MTRDEFTLRLGGYLGTHPDQRYGQAVFNLAWRVGLIDDDFDLDTNLDPYYDDTRVPTFLDHIFGKEDA